MNTKYIMLPAAILALGTIVTACGKPSKEVSFDALETARGIANDNSKFNAQKWRAENGYEKNPILARGDSTQQTNCPQGDGWASVDLIDPATKQTTIQLKCSTVSPNVGCMTSSDFKSRAVYASTENKCNPDIPYPMKKIEN